MKGIYVYALVSPSRVTPRSRGFRGERLRRIALPGADVIVGAVSKAPAPTEVALRRYDAVIRTLADQYPALLPARFGTTVSDVDELTMVLGARGGAVKKALKLVRNRVQMTIRIVGVGPVVNTAGRRGRPSGRPDARKPGTQYLQHRAEAAKQLKDVPELRPLRKAVTRWIKAERVEHHDKGRLVTAYHLIPRAALRAYQRALERAALDAEVIAIVSGPWPPYAFASSDI